MNKTIVLPMVDGGIIDVSTDNDFSSGCPTCDFGSCYTNKFDIKMTQGTIRVTCEQMYEYPFQKDDDDEDAESWEHGWGNAPWSEGDLMKIILPNNDKIKKMTEDEFALWFEDRLREITTSKEFNYRFIKN